MAVSPIHLMQVKSADKAASTSTPDVPFNQVLSSEMSQQGAIKSPVQKADQNQKTDPAQTRDQVDSSPLASDSSPQVSAEMLAILGQFQTVGKATPNTTPHVDSKLSGEVQTVSEPSLKSVLDNFKLTDKPQLAKQVALEPADNLVADSKATPLANTRADAGFADMLKTAELIKTDPRIALPNTDLNNAQSPLPNQLMAAPMITQPTAVDLSHNFAGQVMDKLTPRVGTPAWDQALGQKITWMIGGAEQSASISLNPPDLGPLQVVLNVTNDQANATFIAAQPEVRLAIEAAMPKLREMMSEAGIQLGQANVSADNPNRQGASSDRNGTDRNDTTKISTENNVIMPVNMVTGQGLVNTFV